MMKYNFYILYFILTLLSCAPKAKFNNPTEGLTGLFAQLLNSLGNSGDRDGIKVTNAPSSIIENQSVEINVGLAGISSETTVSISSNNSAITIGDSSEATLTFKPENSTISQTLKLKAFNDENLISENVRIIMSAPGYKDVILEITAIDDDTQNIKITGATQVPEGGSSSIYVSLTKEPNSSVGVSLASSDINFITLGTNALSFNSTNYSTPQLVTVSASLDANRFSEKVNITASSVGITSNVWNIINIESIRGTITGLTGTLYLLNNGGDEISIASGSNFIFPIPTISYNVSVNYAKTYQSLQKVICAVTGEIGDSTISEQNISVSCSVVLDDATSAGAVALGLFSTGQVISYSNGDDGAYQRTVPRNYTDNGNGTVTDNATGLTWQKCYMGRNNDVSCSDDTLVADTTTWSTAGTYCSGLALAGKTWRRPKIFELSGLLDNGKISTPLLNTTFFPNSPGNRFWVNTTYVYFAGTIAWVVDFSNGVIESYDKANNAYIRCVTP